MNRFGRRILVVIAAAFLMLAGCDPEKLLIWSPDGKTCAVIGPEGMHLADAEGNLSGLLVPKVVSAAWVPGSKRIVVQVGIEDAKWADAEKLLSEEKKKLVKEQAERFLRLAKAETKGSLEKAYESFVGTGGANQDLAMALLVYLRDHHNKEMAERFGEEWTKAADDDATLGVIRVYDLAGDGVREAKLTEGPTLAATFGRFVEIRPNPKGNSVALVEGGEDRRELRVASLDGKKPAQGVAELVARYPDWSPDGKSLLFVRANIAPDEHDSLRLGSLRRLTVCDEQGKLLDPVPQDRATTTANADGSTNETPSAAEVLAGFLYSEWIKVRCLPNGRVLFSGVEAHLPATAADMPTTPTLFAIDPSHPTIARVLPRGLDGSLPAGIHYFEVSPDGTKLAIPGVGGQLAVVTLASGQLVEVSPKKGDQGLKLIPSWRNNDELSFAVPNVGDKKRPAEYTLFHLANQPSRKLSANWPEEMVTNLGQQQSSEEAK